MKNSSLLFPFLFLIRFAFSEGRNKHSNLVRWKGRKKLVLLLFLLFSTLHAANSCPSGEMLIDANGRTSTGWTSWNNQRISGANDVDYFKIILTTRTELSVGVNNKTHGGKKTNLNILASDCSTSMASKSGKDYTLRKTLDAGTYYAKVSYNNGNTNYKIKAQLRHISDLQITKTVDNASVTVGDTVTFTLNATNSGPANSKVTITDAVPSGFTNVSASDNKGSFNCVVSGNNVSCTGNNSLSTSETFIVTITAEASTAGTYTNTANVVSTQEKSDPDLSDNSASVNVTISAAANQPPTATAQSITVDENSTNNPITLTGDDPDGDNSALTYSVVTSPSHGTLNGTAPNLTYTPETGYLGVDSFTFIANDGTDDSDPATVSITVTHPQPPIVENADDLCYEDPIASGFMCMDMGICKGGIGCRNTYPLKNIGNSTLNDVNAIYDESGMGGSFGGSCGVDPSGSCQTAHDIDFGPFGFFGTATEYNLTDAIPPEDDSNAIWAENFMSGSCFNGENLYGSYMKDGVLHRGKIKHCQPPGFTCANPKPFTIVYQINAFGDIVQIGNTNLCADNNHDGQCEDPGDKTNNSINMINDDYDSDPSTFNSTGAELSLPAGAEILYAGLLWQGYFAGNVNDSEKEKGRKIKFKFEGASSYNDLTADEMNWVYFSGTRMYYQSYKDVTDYVKTYGAGYYWAANITSTLGKPAGGSYGAWSLSVAYKDVNGKFKNMTFYHGYQALANNNDINNAKTYAQNNGCDASNTGVGNDTGATLSGFITPKAGDVDAKLTVFTGEGDIGLSGDTVSVTDANGAVHKLANGANPQNNVMNATISFNGSIVTTGKPYISYNSLGIDIDTYDIGNYLSNQQSSTDVDFHTTGDGYMPGFFAFSADLHVPNICYDYSYKQLGRYFTEDNNGSKPPRIVGYIVPNQPITVGIYFRNNEESDIKASNNLLSVDNIGSSPDITYKTGSTEVTYAGESQPVSVTPGGQGAHSFSNLNIHDIGGQEYAYAYYQIDPKSSHIDIPLSADINYTLNLKDIHGNVIPITYKAELGSGKIPLCRGAGGGTGYEPLYNSFNVENPAISDSTHQYYNLYTQVSGRPWDASVVSYGPGNNYNDRNDSAEWIKVEIIDTGAYHQPQASCTERDSNITKPIAFFYTSDQTATGGKTNFVSFNDILDAQSVSKESYYNIAVEKAAYRVWHLVNPNTGEMLQAVCSDRTPMWTFFKTQEGKRLLQKTHCTSECNAAASACNNSHGNNSGKSLDGCLECLYPYISVPVCSRDNFAIRPESFVTRLIDDNTSTVRSVTLSKNPAYSGAQINLAAGYPYRFDVNATSHATNLFADKGVRGYINNFGSFNLDSNRAYMSWTPNPNVNSANCNAAVDQNMSFHLQDGTTYNHTLPWMTPTHGKLSNVGEYTYMVKDSRWTRVDFDPNYLAHHNSGYFKSGYDCVTGIDTVPSVTSAEKVGCTISSVHDNVDTGDKYVALKIRVYPYDINVSLVSDQDTAKSFYYMNNVAINPPLTDGLPIDENHSVHISGMLKPEGKDHTTLSNFVKGCYAEPVTFTFVPSAISAGSYPLRWRETNSTTDIDGISQTVTIDSTSSANAFVKSESGQTMLDLHINFDRNRTDAVNPVDLNISAISADCANTASSPNCRTNADGNTNHTAQDTNASFISDHLMLYGRTHAPRYRVECADSSAGCSTTTSPNQPLKIYEEFYYDRTATIDSNTTLTALSSGGLRSVDSINWYVNSRHTQSDGNISQVQHYYHNDPLLSSPISVTVPTPVTSGVSTINATYNGNNGYPYKATMGISTQPWLIYNRFDATATHNDFELEFNAAQIGDDANSTGNTDKDISAPNTSRRIRW